MKKIYLLFSLLLFATVCFFLVRKESHQNINVGQDPVVLSTVEEEEGEYDGARERNELEIEKTKDPSFRHTKLAAYTLRVPLQLSFEIKHFPLMLGVG